MAEPHVITALVKKRADLAGETPKRRVRGKDPSSGSDASRPRHLLPQGEKEHRHGRT
jgi:hypothetical protein